MKIYCENFSIRKCIVLIEKFAESFDPDNEFQMLIP